MAGYLGPLKGFVLFAELITGLHHLHTALHYLATRLSRMYRAQQGASTFQTISFLLEVTCGGSLGGVSLCESSPNR